MNGLRRAIDYFGNQSRLAEAIGTRQQNISLWLNRGQVPASYVLKICEATQGEIRPVDLRPDLYPYREWSPTWH